MTSHIFARSTNAAHAPLAAVPSAFSFLVRAGRAIWDVLGHLSVRRTHAELLRLATEQETSRPDFAARLRAAARRDWS